MQLQTLITKATLSLSALLLMACGGTTPDTNQGEPTGSTTAPAGCSTAPQCGGCVDCFDKCVCGTGDVTACVQACKTGGSGGGSNTGGASGTGAAPATGGASAGGASAGGAGGGTAGTGGDIGTGGVGGDMGTGGAMMPPPSNVQSTQITFNTVPVQPGGEVFKCQNFANPFGNADVEVIRSESFMTGGSHHMFVFYHDGNFDGGTEDCSGLEFASTIHGASRPQQLIEYPPDVGRRMSGNQGLRILVHFLNTTPAPINVDITVSFDYVPAGTITGVAGSVFANQPSINIAPRSPGNAGGTCTIPFDAYLLGGVSHMHQYGTHFVATATTGDHLYETTEWNEPLPRPYDPPLFMPAGTRIDYACQYNNFSNNRLTFGDSAMINEMCIFSGTYYTVGGSGIGITCALGF